MVSLIKETFCCSSNGIASGAYSTEPNSASASEHFNATPGFHKSVRASTFKSIQISERKLCTHNPRWREEHSWRNYTSTRAPENRRWPHRSEGQRQAESGTCSRKGLGVESPGVIQEGRGGESQRSFLAMQRLRSLLR